MKTYEVVLTVTYHVEAKNRDDAVDLALRKAAGMKSPATSMRELLVSVSDVQ